LEEVLGGHYPPDLSPKILEAWEARHDAPQANAAARSAPAPIAPPIQQLAEPQAPPVHEESIVQVAPQPRTVRRSRAGWLSVAIAASVLLAVGMGYYFKRTSESARDRIAVKESVQPKVVAPSHEQDGAPPRIRERRFVPRRIEGGRHGHEDMIAGHRNDEPPVAPEPDTAMEPVEPPVLPRLEPSSDSEVIAFVDDVLREVWRKNSVTPSPPETDRGWCRRVYDRLVGREPTQDELDRFVQDDSADKRGHLVDRLLASDEYTRHWSDIWTGVFLGPTPASGAGAMASREGLKDYIRESLGADKPYDQMAYDLLVATGSSRPGTEDYNGAVNFLLAGSANRAVAATDRVSRVFLGRQLVCTRCHEHPANEWEQGDFWELNAFLRQMKVRRDPQSNVARLIDQDFYGESGAAKDAEIFYQLPSGRLAIAYPEFNGRRVSRSGLLSDVNRRQELAKLITTTDDFARAAVNRIWAKLLGYGFTQPVDDMGSHNPPSHPEVLERLAGELAAHDFDLDGLIRWTVLSEAFGLSGRRMPESWMDAPAMGGKPLFARYYSKKDEPVEVYRALMTAVNSKPAGVSMTAAAMARRSWVQPVGGVLEIIDTQPVEGISGTGWLGRLAKSRIRTERKIEHLFLSALDRKPTRREMTAAKLVLADRLNDTVAVQEIWRALLSNDQRQ